MRTVLRTTWRLTLAALLLAPTAAGAAPARGAVDQVVIDETEADAPTTQRATPPEATPADDTSSEEQPRAGGATPAPAGTDGEPPAESGEGGGPGAEAPEGEEAPTEPADWRPEPSEENILIDADEVYYRAGATVARGNVTVRYREIVITADEAEIDEDGVWGQFRGNVTITREEVETTAELIRVNFDTEEWEVLGGRTVLEPAFFESGVVEPIYVRARSVAGTEGDEVIYAEDATVTSCNLEHPHYGLHSDHIRLIGEDRVVLERPRLEVLGFTLFRYPWDLVLSQRSQNNRFFPELGQNTVEGFYAKLAYLYLTGSTYNSYVRLHLTEKRGIGLGADHYFRTGPHSGELSLFWEPDEGALSGRARETWEISDELSSNLSLNLQQNTGFYGATESLTGNLALRFRGENATATLGIDHSQTDSTVSSSVRTSTSFTHRQQLGGDASADVRAVVRRTQYGDRPTSAWLETDLQFQQRTSWYDWAMAAEQQWELEGDQGRNYGLDRLPEIVFNTDSRRLGDWSVFDVVPMRATLKAGHFVQYPDEEEISMAAIETYLGGGRTPVGGDFVMTTTGTFDQAFYDEGSARYRVGTSLDLTGEHGGGWNTRLAHRYSTVEGYSPLRRDYGGKYNDVTLSFVQQTRDRSYLDIGSGYDFVDDQWREIRLRGWLAASSTDRIEMVAGYALEQDLWRPVQVRWVHATPWDVYLALSSRYDIDGDQLTDADLEFDWRLDPRWRLEGIATYSGYRGELDQLNLRITRDLHCWLAALTYDMASDEIRLNLGIKAFPFEDQDWTVGERGARLGSYGQYYY